MAIIKNRYPWAIENELSALYLSQIDKLNEKWFPRIIAAYESDLEVDTDIQDTLEGFVLDSQELKQSSFIKNLTRIAAGLNFWSFSTLNAQSAIQATEVSMPKPIIPLINDVSNSVLNVFSSRNADLIQDIVLQNSQRVSADAARQIKDDVANLTNKSITKSGSVRNLSKAIKEATGVIKSKADFWARDQTKLGYRDIQDARFLAADIPGYIWSTVGDGRVRQEHRARHGKFYRQNQLSIEPGDDFRCRCVKIPAWDKSQQYSNTRIKKDVAFMERDQKERIAREKVKSDKKKIARIKKFKTLNPAQKKIRINKVTTGLNKSNKKVQRLSKINKRTDTKVNIPIGERTKVSKAIEEIRNKEHEWAVALDKKGKVLHSGTDRSTNSVRTPFSQIGPVDTHIHNHPHDVPPSYKDLLVAVSNNVRRMIITNSNRTYEFIRPKRGWGKVDDYFDSFQDEFNDLRDIQHNIAAKSGIRQNPELTNFVLGGAWKEFSNSIGLKMITKDD